MLTVSEIKQLIDQDAMSDKKRMAQEGQTGCRTAYDVAPAYLSPKSGEELRATML